MGFSTAGKNIMLDSVGVAYVSAHTADPLDVGSSEVTGGTYARKAITYAAAASGSKAASNQPQIDIPGGTTVTHTGYWDSLTGGVYLGSDDLPVAESFGSDGILTVNTSTLQLT